MQLLRNFHVAAIVCSIGITSPIQALAGGCLGPLCGGVENYSPWPMYWAEFVGGTPGICRIWNGEGGPTEKQDTQNCVLGVLYYGDDKGGWDSGFDVDGFTYLDKDYKVKFEKEMVEKSVKAGSWTKITTNEWASCLEESGQPKCYIFRHVLPKSDPNSMRDSRPSPDVSLGSHENGMYGLSRTREEF